ncbi:MAG: large-conductance mechanosensitive channel protein MscL [Candidatus Berkiella sp.]
MSFISEFKAFAMKGNVIDLAVAVIIGAAFGKIISALVDGIIMPLIGVLLGGIDVSSKAFTLGHAVVKWGAFLQSIIDFTIISFAIFLAVKLIMSLQLKKEQAPPPPSPEVQLLTEIRDLLKNQSKEKS